MTKTEKAAVLAGLAEMAKDVRQPREIREACERILACEAAKAAEQKAREEMSAHDAAVNARTLRAIGAAEQGETFTFVVTKLTGFERISTRRGAWGREARERRESRKARIVAQREREQGGAK